MTDRPDWIAGAVADALKQVVDGVKAAKKNGVACLMPDVVAFEVEMPRMGLYFEVPIEDERDVETSFFEKQVAKVTISSPFVAN